MIKYEEAGKKYKAQALADLQSIMQEAQKFTSTMTSPPPTPISTSTASIAQSMGTTLSDPAKSAPDVSTAPKPTTMTVGDVVKSLSQDFGAAANENHARVRTGFAERLTKLDACIRDNPGDASLPALKGQMEQTMKQFEDGYKKAIEAGDRSMVEPAAAALRQIHTTVDDTLASKAPTVESEKEDKPTLSH
jgi:hypothetical protein